MSRLLKPFYESTWGKTSIPFEVLFADGTGYRNKDAAPEVTIRYKTRRAQFNTMANHGWG